MINVGLCTIAFRTRPITEVLDLAAEIGFDGVEIWGTAPHMEPYCDDGHVASVREAVDARGLAVGVFGSYVQGLMPDFDQRSRDALRIAGGLGTRLVRIWSPPGKPGTLAPGEYGRAVEQLREFCKRAADVDTALAIEFHDNYIIERSDSMLRLIEDVGEPNLKVCWQPSFREDAEDFYVSLEAMLPHVASVHAQNFRGSHDHRAQISDGDVDYQRVAWMLRQAGFEGYMEVEFVGEDDPEAWTGRDSEFLRQVSNSR